MTFSFFFFNDTATTEIYTLSLHDALPICGDDVGTLAVLQPGSEQFAGAGAAGAGEHGDGGREGRARGGQRQLGRQAQAAAAAPDAGGGVEQALGGVLHAQRLVARVERGQHVGHQLVGVVAPVGAQVDDQARDPGLGGGGQGALPAVELAGGAVGKAVEGDVGQVAALGAAQQEGGEGGLGRRQGRGCGGGGVQAQGLFLVAGCAAGCAVGCAGCGAQAQRGGRAQVQRQQVGAAGVGTGAQRGGGNAVQVAGRAFPFDGKDVAAGLQARLGGG